MPILGLDYSKGPNLLKGSVSLAETNQIPPFDVISTNYPKVTLPSAWKITLWTSHFLILIKCQCQTYV